MMGVCASFLAVEEMRRGASPANAIRVVLDRVIKSYELRDSQQCALIALHPSGTWACGSLRPGFRVAARDNEGHSMVEAEAIL
jgi:hypothetical protein